MPARKPIYEPRTPEQIAKERGAKKPPAPKRKKKET